MKTIAFFNNKGGVGKTTLVYHLAWMYAELGFSVVAASECLATLKHYRSLMAMAHEAGKPMFHLKAADGALGGHIYAVQDCYRDFERLAKAIAARCDVRAS